MSLTPIFEKKNAIAIFTDGSKMLNLPSTGAACICPALSIKIKKWISVKTSIYTAECISLDYALDVAIENLEHDFLIFSNSHSML